MCVCVIVWGNMGTLSLHAPTGGISELLRYIILYLASKECCFPLWPSKHFTTDLSSSPSTRHRMGVTADKRLTLHSLLTPFSDGGSDFCRNSHSFLCRSDSEQAAEHTGRRHPFGHEKTSRVKWQPTQTGKSNLPRGPVKH